MSDFSDLITFLPVADVEAAHGFYTGALSLEMVVDQGLCRIYRVSPGGYIGLCEHLGDRERSGLITTLVTDEVDSIHSQLAAAGAAVDDEPRHDERFGIYHFFVDDPDGNRLEIQRFDPPGLAG